MHLKIWGFAEVMMCFLVLGQGGSIDVSLGWRRGLGGEIWAVSHLNVVEKMVAARGRNVTLFQNVTLQSFFHTNSNVTLYENTWH